mgnify:FL=1
MTTDQFFTNYNGRFIDYDGKWGFQCVDLVRQYIKEGLEKEPYSALPAGPTAKTIFQNFPAGGNKHFIKIKNSPTNMPKKGDIVFWGYPLGLYWKKVLGVGLIPDWAGHTAIASVSWLKGLNTFDQNFGYPKFCKFNLHTYTGCLGWLHPR